MRNQTLALATLLLLTGCSPKTPSPHTLQPPEPWVALPHDQWPQIVLTHSAEFKGNRSLEGASGFLMKTEAGNVLGAAVEHLLGESGGIKPTIPISSLDSALLSWVMFPRTKPDLEVKILGSAMRARLSPDNDWLIMKIATPPSEITPLRARKTPVTIGETVFLIGVAYADTNASQRVYTGKVTGRLRGTDRFKYDLSPPVNLWGFSGAPIVDSRGLLVGVMTIWFEPKKSGENDLEGGGEDVTSALESIFPSL